MPGSKKGTTTIDPERMATIVLDAELLGVGKAAKAHHVSIRTVSLYRQKIRGHPEALQILAWKKKDLEARWRTARVNFLLRAVARLDELLPKMDIDQARDIVGAIKILGELHTTQQVLTDEIASEREREKPPGTPPITGSGGGLDECVPGAEPDPQPQTDAQACDGGEATPPLH